ncbi:MAG: hypothetical protein ACKO1J_10095 [Tagaea sp.]
MISATELLNAFASFADVGTTPKLLAGQNELTPKIVLQRNGDNLTILLEPDGKVEVSSADVIARHPTIRHALASSHFADLARWAANQMAHLKGMPYAEELSTLGKDGFQEIDALLQWQRGQPESTQVIVIDGPAGIGKTAAIRQIGLLRATTYRETMNSLLLHVESRGRMLQNLQDLIAFSLQSLRVSVTFDQVPTLIKYGVVVLAIDGFDELGDPSGYDLAWAQLNELVNVVRGDGVLILSGRDTFFGEERLMKALQSIRPQTDRIKTFRLPPLRPESARRFLKAKGWPENLFKQPEAAALLEPDSYALRPFFLNLLADQDIFSKIELSFISSLTDFLVREMMLREARKFGTDIERKIPENEIVKFLLEFLKEVSRELAGNQTEAASSEELGWMFDISVDQSWPADVRGIL